MITLFRKLPFFKSFFGVACFLFALHIGLLEIYSEEVFSDSFNSEEFEISIEDEETSTWIPDSMNGVWDINSIKYTHRKNHLLNPESGLLSFDDYKTFSSLDVEWNPRLGDSLSIRTRQTLEHVTSNQESVTKGYLLEGYLQWKNRSQDVVIDAGKIKLEWGSGYAWMPTQVLFPSDSPINTGFESKEGLEMIQAESVIKCITNTVLVSKKKNETDSSDNSLRQAAYRVSIESQPWEISLVYHKTSEEVNTQGISFTGLLSDAMEIHGEWARTNSRDRLTIVKVTDGVQMGTVYLPARFQYQVDESREVFDKYLLGTQYTFSNSMNLIIELYRTTHGYDTAEWNRIKRE